MIKLYTYKMNRTQKLMMELRGKGDDNDVEMIDTLLLLNTLEETTYNLPLDVTRNLIYEKLRVNFIELTNGDLTTLKSQANIKFLVLDAYNVDALWGTVPEFEGHLFITFSENLNYIGDNFMEDSNVLSISFENCPSLLSVGKNFAAKCSKLTSVDLKEWTNVQTVDLKFLYLCKSLKSVDFSSWNQLVSVGDHFMFGCSSLKNIDFNGWVNIQTIGTRFMCICTSLVEINLLNSNKVSTIGSFFLSGCPLRKIDCQFTNLTTIGDYFLHQCYRIQSIDTSWYNLHTIGNYFMNYCVSIRSIDLSKCGKLVTVGNYFMSECDTLMKVNCSNWYKIRSIGDYFLDGCRSLKTLNFPRSSFTMIGHGFLKGTPLEEDENDY